MELADILLPAGPVRRTIGARLIHVLGFPSVEFIAILWWECRVAPNHCCRVFEKRRAHDV